jgi:hypothetical protein
MALLPDQVPGHVNGMKVREPYAGVAETHSAVVYFAGDRAYKLKKPVNLGFLDFTSRQARAAACARETELNWRFAPDVYLGVAEVRDPGGQVCSHISLLPGVGSGWPGRLALPSCPAVSSSAVLPCRRTGLRSPTASQKSRSRRRRPPRVIRREAGTRHRPGALPGWVGPRGRTGHADLVTVAELGGLPGPEAEQAAGGRARADLPGGTGPWTLPPNTRADDICW